jgi:hypothetical protein
MSGSHKELADALRFQVSLLRLAVVPHGAPKNGEGAQAATELTQLANRIPDAVRKRARQAK